MPEGMSRRELLRYLMGVAATAGLVGLSETVGAQELPPLDMTSLMVLESTTMERAQMARSVAVDLMKDGIQTHEIDVDGKYYYFYSYKRGGMEEPFRFVAKDFSWDIYPSIREEEDGGFVLCLTIYPSGRRDTVLQLFDGDARGEIGIVGNVSPLVLSQETVIPPIGQRPDLMLTEVQRVAINHLYAGILHAILDQG